MTRCDFRPVLVEKTRELGGIERKTKCFPSVLDVEIIDVGHDS